MQLERRKHDLDTNKATEQQIVSGSVKAGTTGKYLFESHNFTERTNVFIAAVPFGMERTTGHALDQQQRLFGDSDVVCQCFLLL